GDLLAWADEPLREEEPDREVDVRPRGAHRHRDADRFLARAAGAGLHRLLGGQTVGPDHRCAVANGSHANAGHGAAKGGSRFDHPAHYRPGAGGPITTSRSVTTASSGRSDLPWGTASTSCIWNPIPIAWAPGCRCPSKRS